MPLRPCFRLILPLAMVAAGVSRAGDPPADPLLLASIAYDAGRCNEVLAIYQALPPATRVDGVSMYRWGFCLADTGQADGSERYERAAEQLATELSGSPTPLLLSFYRVNALLNLGRRDEAATVAREAITAYRDGRYELEGEYAFAWFRVGKLMLDAGEPQAALVPYRRAVELGKAQPGTLRTAHVERIASLASTQGDTALAADATALLEQLAPGSPRVALQRAHLLLLGGRWDEARALLKPFARGATDAEMEARYALALVDRAAEVAGWALRPADQTADGVVISGLSGDELLAALQAGTQRAYRAMLGPAREVALKRGGTRAAPTPETATAMRESQAEMVGLWLEALGRNAPLRVWATQAGFPMLINQKWELLFSQRLDQYGERLTLTDGP